MKNGRQKYDTEDMDRMIKGLVKLSKMVKKYGVSESQKRALDIMMEKQKTVEKNFVFNWRHL